MTQEETAPAIDTLAVHAGERRPGPEGSIVFPIYQGTVYATGADATYDDLKYIRLSTTPTQRYLCDKLGALEGAESALVTASGMAALAGTLTALLEPGDHLLAGECLYGGTHQFLLEDAPRLGLGCTFIDAQRPEVWESALRPKTRLVLLESIGNPLMRVPRLKEMVAFARAHRLTVLMDNTLASPFNLQPLRHGVDLVFHSATKYLNGHSDIVAGCVMGPAAMVERIRRRQNHFGGALDPHAAFLLARGVKTLALRVRAQNANGLALAR
ncbi:MAG TPA: aminotransferase class I/II-fold pyridoxal phosphate-dependent enzyme, partial [Candidatus Polarisedimenticolia bacterium]|nr:aminotransferase class I/II-fold pyridoxal phosphate-dependent enzyme [Candidatus Polarisedimenticolia bacterium]